MTPTLWLTKGSLFLRARAVWAVIFAFVALFVGLASPPPPPRTPEGVAAMLGAAVGAEVRPDDFVWEARGGFFSDAFLGRRVLFLARRAGQGPGATHADLFRARVLLTRSGSPLRLRELRNLTKSPLGDERSLIAEGRRAAYVTHAFGAAQGITLLDLDGDGAPAPRSLPRRIAAAIERWIETGSTRGLGRTEVAFASPPADAKHELQGDLLVMALGKEAVPAALDLRDGALNTGPQNTFGASSQRIAPREPSIAGAAVMATSELLGHGAAGALAGSLDSLAKRFAPKPRSDSKIEPKGAPPAAGEPFPPPPIAPVASPAIAGEGVWTTARSSAATDTPPFAFEAAFRPDPKAPEALVRLIAIDTRQVDLRLAPGVDEPRSPTGLHGSGKMPEGIAADRAVAVFAGGPASTRGDAPGVIAVEPGFAVDRRILAPPVAGRPTVAIADDGRVSIGAWPFAAELVPPLVSLRQAPFALLGEGVRAPEGEAAERSAIGLTPSGQLVYAWSARAKPDTLARALAAAGCSYAVPLAAGPSPSGFAYLEPGAPAKPAAPAMSISPADIAARSPNDLFYLVLRSATPHALSGGSALAPDKGKQPSPAWLPAIHTGVLTALGAQIHVTTFAPGRVAFHLRAGSREPATKAAAALPSGLTDADQAKILASVGLGSAKRRAARGLVIDGAVGFPLRGDDAGVLVLDHGRPRIAKSTEITPSPGVDATELPLTADDGKLRAEARDVGSMRVRAAACVLDDGTFAIASTTFDSDEAATTALLELGCARVVALDRGSHRETFLHRSGTDKPPEARYEPTALFAIEAPLSGRAGPLVVP